MLYPRSALSLSVLLAALPLSPVSAAQTWQSPTGPIAYDDQGSGRLVVCVPGMGDLRQQYRFLTPFLLQAGYRVVTVDLRGQGESTVGGTDFSVAGVGADLAGLIASLGSGPALVIGQSMAAGAAVWLAAEHPELVTRLVLVGPFVRSEPNFWSNLLYTVLFGGFWGADAWAAYYASLYPTRQPEDFAAYRAALRSNLAQPGRMDALRAMLYASKGESERRLPKVAARTLVLMGTKDPDFSKPEVEAQWVAEKLRGTFVMIPGAGHYPHAEFPDLVAPLILDFLAE